MSLNSMMKNGHSLNFKEKLYGHCIALVQDRLERIRELVQSVANSSENDTKSSMGDKYETSREMMQQEMVKLELQLKDATKNMLILKSVQVKPCDTAQQGAIISTDKGIFFISAPLGKCTVDHVDFYAISAQSPIAVAMNGLAKDDSFEIRGNRYTIKSIE